MNHRKAAGGLSRRSVIQAGAAALWLPGVLAEELTRTASLGEGPFYPDKLPLDTDNDLLILNDSVTPALGQITHLSGRVLNQNGSPIRNAFVEIWQCDNNGVYLHSGSANGDQRDAGFQGYGRFLTDSQGRYYFRTIRPVPYPGRTPHIHFGISRNGHRIFTTQMLIKGHEQNATDSLFRNVKDEAARKTLLAEFRKMEDSPIDELSAEFDIVLGRTAHEDEHGNLRGVGRPDRETRRRG